MKSDSAEHILRPSAFTLSKPLLLFLGIDVALLALAGFTESLCRFVFHLGPPFISPLLKEHFPDLLTLHSRFQYFHTLQFFTDTKDARCMYPAPVAVCYKMVFLFRPHDLGLFLSFVVLSFVIAAVLFGRSLIRQGLGSPATVLLLGYVLLTSFPLWFELKQANMEIFSWIFLCIGLFSFLRERGYTAAACFGIAGALKIIPFLYLGLFLARRQYRLIFFALLVAAAVTLPSLWLVYPHISESLRLTNLAISKFRSVVTLRNYPQTTFDHSLFGLIKEISFRFVSPDQLSEMLTAYSAISLFSFLVLYFTRIQRLPLINQVLCLCVATLILPPTSFDYTLLSLYLPWALLVLFAVQQGRKHETVPGLSAAMVCFAMLFVPETEMILYHHSFAGQFKALVLIALFYIGVSYPFQDVRSTESELKYSPGTLGYTT
jgi:hypothetical protein